MGRATTRYQVIQTSIQMVTAIFATTEMNAHVIYLQSQSWLRLQ